MSFSERFEEYRQFDLWITHCVRKYFRYLQDNQIELPHVEYLSRPPISIRETRRLEDYEFVGGELHLTAIEYHMGDRLGETLKVSTTEFMEFAKHQWELDQFDQKLEGGS